MNENEAFFDIQQKKNMYTISLLNETLPQAMMSPAVFEALGFSDTDRFGVIMVVFSNEMKAAIEAKDRGIVADWKSSIDQGLTAPLKHDAIDAVTILNMAPYTRTLVYRQSHPMDEGLRCHLKSWFHRVNTSLKEATGAELMAFVYSDPVPFAAIGKPYKILRNVQSYQYTLGMGTLTFSDGISLEDDHSVTAYKFLQRFERCLTLEDVPGMLRTTADLTAHLTDYGVKDSKVIYVCKELMSVTIRHLFSHETAHLSLIEALNGAINNFTSHFNDLKDFNAFMATILQGLVRDTATSIPRHPHVHRLIQSVERHFADTLTLDSLSEALGLSSAYLSRLFKEAMGISFKQYLTKYRMDYIKTQLLTTNDTIQAIAARSGYQTANQLTRIFKKYEQTTPRDFRQQAFEDGVDGLA